MPGSRAVPGRIGVGLCLQELICGAVVLSNNVERVIVARVPADGVEVDALGATGRGSGANHGYCGVHCEPSDGLVGPVSGVEVGHDAHFKHATTACNVGGAYGLRFGRDAW